MQGRPLRRIDFVTMPNLNAQPAFSDAPSFGPHLAPFLGRESRQIAIEVVISTFAFISPVELDIVAGQ